MTRAGAADTHVSLTWTGILPPPPDVPSSTRPSDWNLGGLRNRSLHAKTGFSLVARNRSKKRLLICNAGMDVVAAAIAKRVVAPRLHLTAVDFLRPPAVPQRILRFALRQVDEFVVIRSGDIKGLEALGVDPERCRFVPFPAPSLGGLGETPPEPSYIYSGGTAQRDWETFTRAVELAELPAVVGARLEAASEHVRSAGSLSPEEGRRLLARATFVALSTFDNHLPAGPLLLLDAMVLGKAVVATDTPAHRDYIEDGVNGLLVPAGDAAKLAAALKRVWGDPGLQRRLGTAAAASAAQLTADHFWTETLRR